MSAHYFMYVHIADLFVHLYLFILTELNYMIQKTWQAQFFICGMGYFGG